jgi:hypothetical protein
MLAPSTGWREATQTEEHPLSMSLIRKSTGPIGHRKNGQAIWGYSGAMPDDGGDDGGGNDGDDDSGGGSDEDEDEDGDDGLTAAGRKAIEAERKAAKRAKDAYRPFAQLARDTGLSVDEMRKRLTEARTGGTDSKDGKGKDEVDVDEIRRQATAEVSAKSDARFIRAAVKASAASVLNDPADALRYLDLSDYEVDADGEVDEDQVKRDLTRLIRDRPYLKKKSTADFDGGPRGKAPSTGSMSDVIRRAAGVIR